MRDADLVFDPALLKRQGHMPDEHADESCLGGGPRMVAKNAVSEHEYGNGRSSATFLVWTLVVATAVRAVSKHTLAR